MPAPDAPKQTPAAAGVVAGLRRHPVKGFTPEALADVTLAAGAPFPADRLYAVENGPSGFDPSAPGHVSKQRFTVLASIPALARVRTSWDDDAGVLHAALDGTAPFCGRMDDGEGRDVFCAWLTAVLDALDPDARRGPLRLLQAQGWRFFDDQAGAVSVLNLASVRDLGGRIGAALNPDRFRANLWVEGWPAWSETALTPGARLRIGGAVLEVVKPIRRCVATHVDPATGVVDQALVADLMREYGHAHCGLYLRVLSGGAVREGDAATFVS